MMRYLLILTMKKIQVVMLMNLVMSDKNKIIEIQSSSEKGLHNIQQLNLMYENGLNAIDQLFIMQEKIID